MLKFNEHNHRYVEKQFYRKRLRFRLR